MIVNDYYLRGLDLLRKKTTTFHGKLTRIDWERPRVASTGWTEIESYLHPQLEKEVQTGRLYKLPEGLVDKAQEAFKVETKVETKVEEKKVVEKVATTATPTTLPVKRRGRPPGSKNKKRRSK